MNLQELKAEFQNMELPESVQLTKQELITDVKKFVSNHISVLENNAGNYRFLPYFNRLLKLYKICKPSTT
jgi:hypothetical protein